MSKVAKPCSSCPAAPARAAPAHAPSAENASPKKGNKIKFLLEDVLGQGSDGVIKVKKFTQFLDYDVQRLNMTGELLTYTHRNGFTHIKMSVTYKDKTTNKVNYLELDFINDTKKEERSKNTPYCQLGCWNDGSCFPGCQVAGVMSTATDPGVISLVKSSKVKAYAPVILRVNANGAGTIKILNLSH